MSDKVDRDELTRLLVEGTWSQRRAARQRLRRLRALDRTSARAELWQRLLPAARKRGIALGWFLGLGALCLWGLIESWVR